ncbi:hypothetical protein [Leptobacterium sp. I13]|uniref:hypothetical protein n=1 Tax=Leptobacterium meishanense TaxID=3128904 RepID=UPI0030EDD508
MKTIFSFLSIFAICMFANAIEKGCSQAHSPASYVLSHTKKSLDADNFDHQRYYAERALEALEKTKAIISECGCEEALNAIAKGYENLTKASDPEDWDKGRYYVKKAYADSQDLISSLEVCTTLNNNGFTYSTNSEFSESNIEEQALIEQQRLLEEQQLKLMKEQKKLEEQLEEQRKLKELQKLNRQKELQQQIELKIKAEQAILKFEKSILEVINTLDCRDAYELMYESYARTEKALENEDLNTTRKFYAEKSLQIIDKALINLQNCSLQSP